MERREQPVKLWNRFLNKTWAGKLLDHYWAHDVARDSAALTYYFFFAFFPLIIFVSTLIGLMDVDVESISSMLRTIMPVSAVEWVESYLSYVTENQNSTLMWFSLFFSVYFPFRAANTLMRSVRRAYHVRRPKKLLRYNLKVLIFTVLLLLTILVGFAAAVVGRRLLAFVGRYITIHAGVAEIWLRLRFILLAAIVWAMIAIVYGLAQDERIPVSDIYPGALVSLVCWLLTTLGFSYYVEHFANYSIIYGSIGAAVVMLVWLNLSAQLMIMGAEFNMIRIERRERKLAEKERKDGENA